MAILFFSLFCFVSIGLFAQSSAVEQKLVGTWVDGGNRTWVFNSDGTGTRDNTSLKFAAFSGKIIIYIGNTTGGSAFEYIFAADNNTVILFSNGESSSFFLKKKI